MTDLIKQLFTPSYLGVRHLGTVTLEDPDEGADAGLCRAFFLIGA